MPLRLNPQIRLRRGQGRRRCGRRRLIRRLLRIGTRHQLQCRGKPLLKVGDSGSCALGRDGGRRLGRKLPVALGQGLAFGLLGTAFVLGDELLERGPPLPFRVEPCVEPADGATCALFGRLCHLAQELRSGRLHLSGAESIT